MHRTKLVVGNLINIFIAAALGLCTRNSIMILPSLSTPISKSPFGGGGGAKIKQYMYVSMYIYPTSPPARWPVVTFRHRICPRSAKTTKTIIIIRKMENIVEIRINRRPVRAVGRVRARYS